MDERDLRHAQSDDQETPGASPGWKSGLAKATLQAQEIRNRAQVEERDPHAERAVKRSHALTFSDLFHGNDQDGLRIAFYEASLRKRSGKSTYVVFSGQVYAFQRRARSNAEIVIVPDRGLFNFFKPAPGAERVKFETDPEFERKFEVYATEPGAAQLLIGSDVRRTLLELRQAGKVFAYIGGEDAFVAVAGKNRFEPGGMFRPTPSDQRIRAMFDDVCASVALLERLKAVLG